MNSPDITLETDRLTLTPISARHAPAIHAALQDWDVVRFLARIPWPYTEQDAQDFIALAANGWETGEEHAFAVEADDFIGVTGIRQSGLNGDLGYWLAKPAWGRGYASEAVAALRDYAFSDLNRDDLSAHVVTENVASVRVLEKCGFKDTGPATCSTLAHGDLPAVGMRITRAEWEALQ